MRIGRCGARRGQHRLFGPDYQQRYGDGHLPGRDGDTWVAPAGVTQATFDLQGGAGGWASNLVSTPGDGGHVTASLAVAGGVTYYITVGAQGSDGVLGGQGMGAAPGGGTSGLCTDVDQGCMSDGGGGGGASVLATTPVTADTGNWLLAAGGDGGAGAYASQPGGSGGGITGGDAEHGTTGGRSGRRHRERRVS